MHRMEKLLLTAVLALVALPAAAHPEQGVGDFMSGMLHPLLGIDHLLVMIAVGIWAVQLGSRALWAVPLSFVLAMAAGAALGYAGVAVPLAEPVIALSVLVCGLLVVSACKLSPLHGAAIVGAFALFHGAVHATETAAGAAPVTFIAGVLAATVALHLTGAASAAVLRSRVRLAGLPLILSGAWLLGRALV